jgi:hypothetical protein
MLVRSLVTVTTHQTPPSENQYNDRPA